MRGLEDQDPMKRGSSLRSYCEVKGRCVLYKGTRKFPDYFDKKSGERCIRNLTVCSYFVFVLNLIVLNLSSKRNMM